MFGPGNYPRIIAALNADGEFICVQCLGDEERAAVLDADLDRCEDFGLTPLTDYELESSEWPDGLYCDCGKELVAPDEPEEE